MKIGAQYVGGAVTIKTFAREAEAAGFDSVWCGDHVSGHVDGIAALGVMAGCTERITVGTSVLVGAFRPAVVTAKALATVATIAPGRMIAGIGVGGDLPRELRAVGVDPESRGAFLDEAIEVMQLLWRGESTTYQGRWTSLEGLTIDPLPNELPPIWIGGRSLAAIRRAARLGTGYLPYLVSPAGVTLRKEQLIECTGDLRRRWEGTLAAVTFVTSGTDREAALDEAMSCLPVPGLTRDQVRSRWLLGAESDLVARARCYRDAGVDHLILGCPPGDRSGLDRFLAAARCLLDEFHDPTPWQGAA